MRRLAILLALVGLLGGAGAPPRVVILATRGERLAEGTPTDVAFRAELQQLGWNDDALRIEHRDIADLGALPAAAAAIARERPDVIVASGTMQAVALGRETRDVPIVAAVADPVAFGFAGPDLRPIANVTGTGISSDFWRKKVELLRQVSPGLRRLYVIADPGYDPGWPVESTIAAAREFGIECVVMQARSLDDLRSFLDAPPAAASAVMVMNSPSLARAVAGPLAAFARTHRVPVLAPYAQYARAGALLAYEEDAEFRARRVAAYVDRVLRGAPVADLKFERIDRPRVTLNDTTARQLGITVPHAIRDTAIVVSDVPQDATVPPEARATIAAANADWIPALKKHDADAVAAPYAEDGEFVAATGEVFKGRAAVARMMRDRFAQMGSLVNGTIVQDGLTRQGDFIYEWGHADLELAHDGAAAQHSRGRYLTVWRRSSAGRWQIVRNLSLPE